MPYVSRCYLVILGFFCSVVLGMGAGHCADGGADSDLHVVIGYNGTWKLGHILPVGVILPAALDSAARIIEVQSVDGDGVDVVYRKQLPLSAGSSPPNDTAYTVPIRIGRLNTTLKVRIVAVDGSILASTEIQTSGGNAGLPSNQPLILALGSAMGVDEVSRTSADGTNSTLSTVVIDSPEQLPRTWRGYSSCDLIVIQCGTEFLNGMTAERWTAIDVWIQRGGSCILSIDASADAIRDLNANDRFQQLLPGQIVGLGQVDNPGLLESLIATDEPIRSFPVALIEPLEGNVELQFSDTLSRSVPWWISYAHGSGTIRLIASNLDDPAFANWKDRRLLWAKLLTPFFERSVLEDRPTEKETSDSSYLGYDDLVGQLRATLDVFSSVRVVSFGQIAAMLVGVLLLIGPLDYYISVKWLKRPQFSWYFAGFVLCGTSAGLIMLYAALRPDEIRVNTAQIIDVDTETGALHGNVWAHIYCGNAHAVNIEANASEANASEANASEDSSPVFLDWQGLPGTGLGGLRSQLNTDRGMPSYVVDIDVNDQSKIRSVGIPAAGTKCVFGSWLGTTKIRAQSNLRELPGIDQLTGELANPLDVDIKDAMLFYHNWYYRLDSRIPSGGSVPISSDTIPKDLARRLNGRKTVDGKHTNTKWSPGDRSSLDRLLELMMFHKAATGRNYTSLAHRYQPHIDHSNLLETDVAILVGRIDTPLVSIDVSSDDHSRLVGKPELSRVWCRLTIPVNKQFKN